MRIEFTREYKIALRGVEVVTFQPGISDVPEVEAKAAIADGAAREFREPTKAAEAKENKPDPSQQDPDPKDSGKGKRRGR